MHIINLDFGGENTSLLDFVSIIFLLKSYGVLKWTVLSKKLMEKFVRAN